MFAKQKQKQKRDQGHLHGGKKAPFHSLPRVLVDDLLARIVIELRVKNRPQRTSTFLELHES